MPLLTASSIIHITEKSLQSPLQRVIHTISVPPTHYVTNATVGEAHSPVLTSEFSRLPAPVWVDLFSVCVVILTDLPVLESWQVGRHQLMPKYSRYKFRMAYMYLTGSCKKYPWTSEALKLLVEHKERHLACILPAVQILRALDLQSAGRGFKSYSEQKLCNNLGQVVHTYVPLSPSSITLYRPRGGDALWLGNCRPGRK